MKRKLIFWSLAVTLAGSAYVTVHRAGDRPGKQEAAPVVAASPVPQRGPQSSATSSPPATMAAATPGQSPALPSLPGPQPGASPSAGPAPAPPVAIGVAPLRIDPAPVASRPPRDTSAPDEPRAFDIRKDSRTLVSMATPANAAGEFRRISILDTSMKYPLVRVEETVRQDGPLAEERVLNQVAAVADHVVVKVQPGTTEESVAELARQYGGAIRKKLTSPDTYLIEVSTQDVDSLPKAVAALSADKALVAYAEPDYVVHSFVVPNDPSFSQLWGMSNIGQTGGVADADIDAPEAWSVTTGSSSIVVGLIDTGVDYNHPDLAPNIWTNPGEIPGNGIDDDNNGYIDDVRGWNFVAENNNPADDHFHGTHCAGTIGARGNDGVGVAGVNWQVKIIPLKFLASNGGGVLSDAVEAVRYATRVGARLTSNSWGGGGYSQALKDAIDAANTAGSLFIAAAGNDASDNDLYPSYPASYSSANIISVAATDHADQLAGFSNFGKTSVHLAAPGVGILSTFPTTVTPAMTAYGLSAGYGRISGTSMATPHVAGVAALALAQNPALSAADLRTRLISRSDRLTNLAGVVQSAGRLNAFGVVNVNWQPAPAQLLLNEVAFSDSEGNNDGFANPGETVRLSPRLLNVGGQPAAGVSVAVTASQAGVTILAPSTISAGTIQPYSPATLSAPFRVQTDASLADNAVVTLDFVVQVPSLADQHVPYTFVVSRPKSRAEVQVNFALGEMKADPARNLVYLINRSDRRLLALDTAQGQIVAMAGLDGSADIAAPVENGSLRSGQLAISLDGSKIYVALTASRKIQVLSLPDLAPLVTLPLDFAPESLVSGVNGRLFATSTEYWGKVREVNTANGQVVQSFDKGSSQQFYMHSLLRANAAGTRLFVAETGLMVVGGPGYVYEYDIAAATPALVKTHPHTMTYLKDFAVDEQQQRIYTLHGGIYGVQVTEMATGVYGKVWPFGSAYAAGLAFLPNDPVIYGASGDAYSGNIRKFRRTDGLALGDYVVARSADPVPPRGLSITPNGNLVYLKTKFTGNTTLDGYQYFVGIVGRDTLDIANPPVGETDPNIALSTVALADLEGNGDGVANSAEIISLAPSLRNIGGKPGANVSLEITAGTGATLLSPATQSLGAIAPGATVSAAAYRVQLASLGSNTAVNFTFTARWDTGQVKTFQYAVVIRATAIVGDAVSSYQLGEILADQQRNTVYVLDRRFLRLQAFDTNTGHFTKSVSLAGPKKINGQVAIPGQMTQSVDGTRLYVALRQEKMIQVFSLPDLTSLNAWSYSFEPVNLACDASNRVYVTTSDALQKLVQIDATTGLVLSQTGGSFNDLSILRRNSAGTEVYANLSGSIYRYSTAGAGAPSLIGTRASGASTIIDYQFDEANSRFCLIQVDGNVTMLPLVTGAVTKWPLNSYGGAAVAFLPGSDELLGASNYSNGGGIRRYKRATGQVVQDYDITGSSGNGTQIPYRCMAITPNGRVVYVKTDRPYSNVGSLEGYTYWLGMIGGGTVDLDLPTGDPIVLKSVVLTDPVPGNNDGFANPGETVQLATTFKNLTDYTASGVSIQLTSSDPLALVQGSATRSVGNVGGYVGFTPAPNWSIQLNSALPDGREVKLTFRVSQAGLADQLIPYSIFVAKPLRAEVQVNFAIGEITADKTRNLVYVVDQTNQRVLAINTEAGNVTAVAKLAAPANSGRLAISVDGGRLYVALTNARRIQAFTLPALEQADIFDLDFQPVGLAAGADGKLYVSSAVSWENLRQIDPSVGKVVGKFGSSTYYGGAMLKTGGDGRSLFVAELGLSGSTGEMDEFTIGDEGYPVFKEWHPFALSNTVDVGIDDSYRRIYTMNGGVYGVSVTEMETGVGKITWSFGGAPYGAAVCFLPGDTYIHGASAYEGVFRFNRADGRRVAQLPISSTSYSGESLTSRGLAVTPNGKILYVKNKWTGNSSLGVAGYYYYLGIIGQTAISVNATNQAPLIDLGTDKTVRLSQSAALASILADDGAISSLLTSWSMVSGARAATFAASVAAANEVSFSAPGVYRLRATTSDGQRKGSDELQVTVLADPPKVSITATKPTAYEHGQMPGEITINRTGGATGSLAVKLTTSGTANPGTDYTALPAVATIPDGASSVTLTVSPKTDSNGETDETVIATLGASTDYEPGVSTVATVTIRDLSLANWQADKLAGVSPELRLPDADPNRNGVSNLLEYAFGLDPLGVSNPSALPRNGLTDPIAGERYLTLTYRRLLGSPGINYAIETSDSPAQWPPNPPAPVQMTATPNGDGTETVVVRDTVPQSTARSRFIRLRVTQP